MKLIVGLGNPGREHANTRHNVGFMALDRLATRHAPGAIARGRFHGLAIETRLPGGDAGTETRALLLKPTTYMNRSGQAVAEAARYYKLDPAEDVLVLVDDTALPAGAIRVRGQGSDGGHNGLADINRALGSSVYGRCRIGIDDRGRIPQRDYVLGKITEDQGAALAPALAAAADAAELWAIRGVNAAMNRFNVRPNTETSAPTNQTESSDQKG